jgi:hypothetical protein
MKKLLVPILAGLCAVMLFSGCAIELGHSSRSTVEKPTLGQQLVDLQKAKDSGAITDAEFQAQKAKLLQGN